MSSSRRSRIALLVALAAAGALLAGGLPEAESTAPVAAGRPGPGQEWPAAQRADLPELNVDPLLFLDATTAVGTIRGASTGTGGEGEGDRTGADGSTGAGGGLIRLVIESANGWRELRSRPDDDLFRFDNLTATDEELLWTESDGDRPTEIWAARLGERTPARRLTADTGNVLFYGNQHDLVVADGRVHWAAADDDNRTEIRSVALTGGPVRVRAEPGQWALTAWPWLTDDVGGQAGTITMRQLESGQELRVTANGPEWCMCSPAWCRVMVMSGEGLARIDMMRPDGSDRRRIAGPGAQSAVTDVAVLDRFEVLSEPRPDSDLTGTAGLVVHDLRTGRTVELARAADLAATRDGMLWWSTGDRESAIWHTLDLRTI